MIQLPNGLTQPGRHSNRAGAGVAEELATAVVDLRRWRRWLGGVPPVLRGPDLRGDGSAAAIR